MKRSEVLKVRENSGNQNTITLVNENTELNKLKEDFSNLRNEFILVRDKVNKINVG